MDRLFNSFLDAYKSPFGAVPAGTPVRLSLTIPESYGFVEPRVVVARDRGETTEYRMEYRGVENGIHQFSYTLTLPRVGLYFYHFDLYSDFRKLSRGALGEALVTRDRPVPWQLTVYEPGFTTPDWLKGGVLYQIFPDRFCEGVKDKPMPFADRIYRENKHGEPYFWPTETGGYLNADYFGGDFEGIRQKLPYLKDMGVSCIYLNPIFEAHSNHRYNTADYLNADPLLGTNEEFVTLCAEAKKLGIRIILDGVFSHTGSDSRYFNKEGRYGIGGAYHDPNSPYRSWYDFGQQYPSGYRCWWGFDTLPEVNEFDPAYQEFICGTGGVIDTWMRRGASGFRLDVADELPDSFIEKIRLAVKAHGQDSYLLGEVWEDASTKEAYGQRRTYLLGRGLDAVMNYPFKNAILDYLRTGSAHNAAEQIMSICEHYPAPALNVLMNFMSTHDTERAITALAGDPLGQHDRYWQSGRRIPPQRYDRGVKLLILAYALLYMLPGVPCIYYGDEVAMQGYKDPFNRAYFDWDSQEKRIRPVLRNLARMRQDCDAFTDGTLELVRAQGGLLHLRRRGRTQTAEMIFNCSNSLIVEQAFGKTAEVNPWGFTVLVEDNEDL